MKNLPLLILILLATGCYKESLKKAQKINGIKWSGAYAVPAANVDIGLDDILAYSTERFPLGKVGQNVVFIGFQNTIRSVSGEEFLKLSNHSNDFTGILTSPEQTSLTSNGTVLVQRDFAGSFLSGYEIDSVSYSSGTLQLNLNNAYAHAASVLVTFPDLSKNGQIVTANFNVGANSSANFNITLNDCKLRLTSGGPGFNHFRCKLNITYTNSGAGFGGSDQFKLTAALSNQRFKRVWGYFGQSNLIDESDSLELSIFGEGKKIKTSNLHFEDPKFKIVVQNTFGIPFKINTSNVEARKNGTTQGIISGFPESKDISAAALNGKLQDSTEKNSGNSNIKTIINNQPKHISYDLEAEMNPSGKIQRNHIDFDSRLTIKVVAELPFNGWAGKVETNDTLDLNVDLEGNEKYVDWITFRMETTNDLPLEVIFQGFFADSVGNILDSIFVPARPLAKAAIIDASGNVVNSTNDKYNITFDRLRIQNIITARQLIFKATLRSAEFNSNVVPIKLTTTQRFRFKLGIHTQVSANEKF